MKYIFCLFLSVVSFSAYSADPPAEYVLTNGFRAYTLEAAPVSSLASSGSSVTTGLFSGFDSASGKTLNPLVYIDFLDSNGSNVLFDINGLTTSSFYGFDPVNISVYGDTGLIDSISLASAPGSFYGSVVYSGVKYITAVSSFSLGLKLDTASFTAAVPVPEPRTYAMLMAGLLALCWAKRHQSRA